MISAQSDQIIVAPPVKDLRGARPLTDDTYAAAAKKYTSSGLPPEMAKQFALQAARNESQIQQQLFELSFPSGANVLELNAQTKKFKGLGGAAPARRAPARRRRR